ncbi:MAG TPA: HEAT repeat domain-containing protein [Pirellula sp.]|nr:HEAT repeat domain-containing protein [Pirellula sp.]
MQLNAPLTFPLQETFRVLGFPSNTASVQVLGRALASPFEQIRVGALQTLINRGGQAEVSLILKRIDLCTEAELPLLANHASLLFAPIEAGLADRDPVSRQLSLFAIAKLQIASQFHHLVRVAESSEDAQQIIASELIIGLAIELGRKRRHLKGRVEDASREQLLSNLWVSMLRFNEHRILQIVDAWLCASHWDDRAFLELFTPTRGDPIYKVALRQLKNSQRPQIIELMAGILWSQASTPEAIHALGARIGPCIAAQLAELVLKLGITPVVRKNLVTQSPIQCLEQFDFSDPANSIQHRCAMIQLFSASNTSPDKILHGIIHLLSIQDPAVDVTCSNALRSIKSLNTEIVVMALSDCFQNPGMRSYSPPPWKSNLRSALEGLIAIYPHQSDNVKSSIQFIFSDFRCEELIRHLDDWPESHLNAYAKIIRIAEIGYIDFIERDAQSPSAVKRSRAIRAVRFLGMDNGLEDVTIGALEDKSEKVRVEAIYTIALGLHRSDAIEVLSPLLSDDDQAVKTAADFALSRL